MIGAATEFGSVVFSENTTGAPQHRYQQQQNEYLVYFQFHIWLTKILHSLLAKPVFVLLSSNFNIQKVLVAPLDWGLGHATRCIPIIRALIANGFTVVLAAEGAQASLLQTEFPTLSILPLRGYRVRYSKRRRMLPLSLLVQLPRLLLSIRREKQWLDRVIQDQQVDLVISDNRYGLFSEKVSCVFITHQLTIKAPFVWLEVLLQKVNYHFINRFTTCWVPDAGHDPILAGVLSHPQHLPRIPVQYIGLLSRFRQRQAETVYDYCILLSGPEPQRSLLEEKFVNGLAAIKGKCLLVRGKPGSEETLTITGNVTVKNHLPGKELETAILQSKCIVSRSGYTTVMELLSLGKKALLIPTPGQTEQEYLAATLQQKAICTTISQEAFICSTHLPVAMHFIPQPFSVQVFQNDSLLSLLRALPRPG